MTAFDLPADLVDLQRRFYEMDARCEAIGRTHPRPTDVGAGLAVISAEQHTELAAARAERLEVVEALNDHDWWASVTPADRAAAKAALRQASGGPPVQG